MAFQPGSRNISNYRDAFLADKNTQRNLYQQHIKQFSIKSTQRGCLHLNTQFSYVINCSKTENKGKFRPANDQCSCRF